MVETRNAYKILLEKHERKRPIGRPKRGWKNNIRMDHRETVRRLGLDSFGSGETSGGLLRTR